MLIGLARHAEAREGNEIVCRVSSSMILCFSIEFSSKRIIAFRSSKEQKNHHCTTTEREMDGYHLFALEIEISLIYNVDELYDWAKGSCGLGSHETCFLFFCIGSWLRRLFYSVSSFLSRAQSSTSHCCTFQRMALYYSRHRRLGLKGRNVF
jgi:hypothetical protein